VCRRVGCVVCGGFYLFGAAVLRVCVCQVCSVCSAALLCAGWLLEVLWAVAGVLPSLSCASAPRLKFDVAGLCRVVGFAVFWGFAPSLAWRAARRGRVCRGGCFTPAGCFLCLVCCLLWWVAWRGCRGFCGLFGVGCGCFCCAAVGAAACRLVVGVGSEFLYRGVFVCLWSLWRLGGVLWSF